MSQYARAFAEDDIDVDILPDLTDEDLKDLGLSLGHRRKLLRGVSNRAETSDTESPREEDAPQILKPSAVSSPFCDLVGSTRIYECSYYWNFKGLIIEYLPVPIGQIG